MMMVVRVVLGMTAHPFLTAQVRGVDAAPAGVHPVGAERPWRWVEPAGGGRPGETHHEGVREPCGDTGRD
jgi:hypothetical protein